MTRYDTGTDDTRVRVRPPKSKRPRTKRRPDYSKYPTGRVVGIDRGRFAVAVTPTELQVTTKEGGAFGPRQIVAAVKAREIPKGSLVIGDVVRLTGDLSGRENTLARIVQVEPRENVLRRSLEEASELRGEKVIVANADLMVIVVAATEPAPRVGMVDRCLVAAHEAGIPAVLCITKADLRDSTEFAAQFEDFDIVVLQTSVKEDDTAGLETLHREVDERFSVLVGHSGVGKSTLINALVEGADRAVGKVNAHTGKGRHTSTSAVALPLPDGGWIVDTPGIRSFGLAHVSEEDVLAVFPGITEAAEHCMPNCSHLSKSERCSLDDEDVVGPAPGPTRKHLVSRARSLLEAIAARSSTRPGGT